MKTMLLIVTLLLASCSSTGGSVASHGCDPNYIPPKPARYIQGAPVYEFRSRIEQRKFTQYNSRECKAQRQVQMAYNYKKLIEIVEKSIDSSPPVE